MSRMPCCGVTYVQFTTLYWIKMWHLFKQNRGWVLSTAAAFVDVRVALSVQLLRI